MRENRITTTINKSLEDVFEFTTNPKKTHLWIPSVVKEISTEYPPKKGTIYRNRGKGSGWDSYWVSELENNRRFTLENFNGLYIVRYTYERLKKNQTELEYFEWMRRGELENPFTQDTLLELKSVMEEGVLF